jgi:uncharacterized membrane protein YwaF
MRIATIQQQHAIFTKFCSLTILSFECFHICFYSERSEEVGQLISELSRELSTNEIALFSIVFISAEFGQKNLHSTEIKINRKKILILKFSCKISSVVVILLLLTIFSEVNFIFNVILMFEVASSLNMFTMFKMKYLEFPWFDFLHFC